MKNFLSLIVDKFSEIIAGSYDMPLQLQFDFQFSTEGPEGALEANV